MICLTTDVNSIIPTACPSKGLVTAQKTRDAIMNVKLQVKKKAIRFRITMDTVEMDPVMGAQHCNGINAAKLYT